MSSLDILKPYAPMTVNIQGKVSFSHISKMYAGEELEEVNKRTVEHGGKASNRPYCTITIDNPYILNFENLPPEVQSVMLSRIKPGKDGVPRYYATSKSPSLPAVAYSIYAGQELAGQGIADRYHPLPKELDTGLTITIGAKIFNTKQGVGLGIDYILIDEPIRYYEPNNLANMLEQQGITYVAPTDSNTYTVDENTYSQSQQYIQQGNVQQNNQQYIQQGNVQQNNQQYIQQNNQQYIQQGNQQYIQQGNQQYIQQGNVQQNNQQYIQQGNVQQNNQQYIQQGNVQQNDQQYIQQGNVQQNDQQYFTVIPEDMIDEMPFADTNTAPVSAIMNNSAPTKVANPNAMINITHATAYTQKPKATAKQAMSY